MSHDLRSYLDLIRREFPKDYFEIEREVDPAFEITSVCERLQREGRFPALLFKHVKGSKYPVLINSCASVERLGRSIGLGTQELVSTYADREASGLPVREIPPSEAPVKQVVLKGEQADLTLLPLTQHCESDAGKYISASVSLVRDPSSGRVNAGIYRLQLQGPRQLGWMVNPANHANYLRQDNEDRGQRTEVAVCIGHHPAFYMAGVSKVMGAGGELEVFGGLTAEPLRVTRGETIDLPIPADCEIVIEGYIPAHERHYEGTFGEWPGYYNKEGDQPYIVVTAINMRRDAICQDLFNAHPEHTILGAVPRMGSIYRNVRAVCPALAAVNLPFSGGGRSHCYIALKKRAEGEPKQAAFAAFMTESSIKHVVVVDEDIDVFNDAEVLWAVAMRFQADRDLAVIPNALGSHLNPSAYGYDRMETGPMETKMIIDATRPLPPVRFPALARAPRAMVDAVKLEEYGIR